MILTLPSTIRTEQLDSPGLDAIGRRMSSAVRRTRDAPLIVVVSELLAAFAEKLPPSLIDELAGHVCSSNRRDLDDVLRKVCEEADLVDPAVALVDRFASDRCNFVTVVIEISALHFGQPQPFRRVSAGITRDSHGRQIMFPSPADSVAMLEELDRQIRSRMRCAYELSAVLAMVGFVHAHPFADGNGRIARTLFAALMRWGGPTTASIPVLALQCLSYPSFLIRTRRAQCSGNWAPIASHMACTLDCLADVSTKL